MHPAWEPNHAPDAVWISYNDTGYQGRYSQPFMDHTPVMDVIFNFNLPSAGLMNLKVWADDSADVVVDGVQLIGAAFTQSTCSGTVIGCVHQDGGSFVQALSAGAHNVTITAYQVGTGTNTTDNPFGVLAVGSVNTPEPATLGMMGAGLIALAVFGRRRFC